MKKNNQLATLNKIMGGIPKSYGTDDYIKTKNGSYLKPHLAEEAHLATQYRWKNGGKRIQEKFARDPAFSKTAEYKNHFKRFKISIPSL